MAVALEDFITEREPFLGDDETDTDLLAVEALIARVPAAGLRVSGLLALEVGRGHVVEEDVVLDGKELPQAFLEMGLDLVLQHDELVERAVQTVVVDVLLADAQEIGERTLLIEALGDGELARRLTEAGGDQHLGQPGSRDLGRPPGERILLAALRQEPVKELAELEPLHELDGEPDVAKAAAPLQAHLADINLDVFWGRLVKEARLVRRAAFGRRLRLKPAADVHVTEVGNHMMARAPLGADTLNERPVFVPLAVLADCDLAEEHADEYTTADPRSARVLVFTTWHLPSGLASPAPDRRKLFLNRAIVSNMG